MLRLFGLRNARGQLVVDADGYPLWFDDKKKAKQARDEGQTVTFGPDHHKYKGGKR